MQLPRLSPSADRALVVQAVRRAGAVVIEGLASPQIVANLAMELNGFLDRVPYCEGSFTGARTKRIGRLVAKSPTCHELLMHPLVLDAVADLVRGECYDFQVHATNACRIDPGETQQSLHRDDTVYPFRHPSPPCHINTIWALTEFTEANGATRIAPGSHLWDDERRPDEQDCQVVEMQAGSLLLFDAATYHGAGANTSMSSRTAVILGYTLGWLRQEENQYLAVPPSLAATLPRRLQQLLGYTTHGYLGWFEGQDPEVALKSPVPDVLPAQDLFGPELEALAIRKR